MTAYSELIKGKKTVGFGKEAILFPVITGDVPGGRTVDVTGFTNEEGIIPAGHVIIKTSTGDYKPLALAEGGESYASVPSSATVIGLNKTDVELTDAKCAIMVAGTCTEPALPTALTADIKAALKGIVFLNA